MNNNENIVIRIPDIKPAKKWLDFIELAGKLSRKKSKYKGITFSFGFNKTLNTNQLVTLACLVELFYIQGFKIRFYGGSASLKNFLTKIRFKEYWKEGFNRTLFTPVEDSTTFCLWNITPDFLESYSITATQYYERLFNNTKDLSMFKVSLNEVFNNIFDHSKSKVNGYIITQYYPEKERLSFSCCDLGIGICQSVKNFLQYNLYDKEALIKALSPKFSTQSVPSNRGLGLSNIKDFVLANNGMLKIYSNSILYVNNQGNERFYHIEPAFKGTLIQVEVSTVNFEPKELDYLDF